MTVKYQVESLLRPAVEFYPAFTYGAGAIWCATAPSTLMLMPDMGYASAVVMGYMSYLRFRDGNTIRKYQNNLKRLPSFDILPQKIPFSSRVGWLGKGFEWKPIHTQRLRDATGQVGQFYTGHSRVYVKARKLEVWCADSQYFKWGEKMLGWDSKFNPLRPLPPIGGSPLPHAVEMNEVDCFEQLSERVGHKIVYGATRTGKSRLAEIYLSQDIARNDGAVVCVDPKGDAGLLRRMFVEAKRNGRDKEFYIFHLGYPSISARYNAVGTFSRISEVATRSTSQLSGEGSSAAFKEFCWRFANMVAQARVGLGVRPSYVQIMNDIMDMEPLFLEYVEALLDRKQVKRWREEVQQIEAAMNGKLPRHMTGRNPRTAAFEIYLTRNRIFDSVSAGLLGAIRYDRTYFDKLTASLLPFLEKITSGRLVELVAPDYDDVDDERPILDWYKILNRNAVVYIGLDAMTDRDVASAVGSAWFADLLSTSGFLYKHGQEAAVYGGSKFKLPKLYLHADEFNELCDDFGPLTNKAGGSGVRITAYTQAKADLRVRTGSEAKAAQMEGNFNAMVMMRVKTKDTAELLTDQLGTVEINSLTAVSGASDASDVGESIEFSSKNEDRLTAREVPILEPYNVMDLPKGHAFALVDGARLLKLRFPMIDDSKDNIKVPDYIEDLCADMARKYKTSDEWWNDLSSFTPQNMPAPPESNHFDTIKNYLGPQADVPSMDMDLDPESVY